MRQGHSWGQGQGQGTGWGGRQGLRMGLGRRTTRIGAVEWGERREMGQGQGQGEEGTGKVAGQVRAGSVQHREVTVPACPGTGGQTL